MSAPTRTTFTPGETVTKKHPIRGVLWGLVFGLGLAIVAVVSTWIVLSLVNVVALLIFGVIVGVLWGSLGPARKPAGPAPAPRTAAPVNQTSRFDDFDPPARDEPTDTDDETATDSDGDTGVDTDTSTDQPKPDDD